MLIYNTTTITDGDNVQFPNVETRIYVGKEGFIGSQTGTAINSTHIDSSALIDGSVVGHSALLFNNGSADNSNRVEVGKTGFLYSDLSTIEVYGSTNVIQNAGTIRAIDYSAVAVHTTGSKTLSSVTNSGTITGGEVGAGVYFDGSSGGKLTNTGVIGGGNSSFNSTGSSASFTITNSGTLLDDVLFGSGKDVYSGSKGQVNGVVHGGAGSDKMTGGAKADYFEGDAGRDLLTGGGGADHFIFTSVKDSTTSSANRDLIYDFSEKQGDRIDLSKIDAIESTAADSKFTFVGSHSFTGKAGELHFIIGSSTTMVTGDTDGDKHADFAIELTGKITLHASDFIL